MRNSDTVSFGLINIEEILIITKIINMKTKNLKTQNQTKY